VKHLGVFMSNLIKTLICFATLLFIVCTNTGSCKNLIVGVEASFAPFDFKEPNSDEIKGFDVDIINAIANTMGLQVEIKNMPFDALLPSVLTEQVDVAIAAYSITDERAQIVRLEPYYNSGLGVLVRSEFANKIKTSYDLHGKRICAKTGTTGCYFAENIKDAKVKKYNTEIETFVAIDRNDCDAVIIDKPVIEYYLVTSHDDKAALLEDRLTFETYGIVTSKNNHKLSEKIAKGLKTIKENGTYETIFRKWFGHSSSENEKTSENSN